jgi:hypothetical protein
MQMLSTFTPNSNSEMFTCETEIVSHFEHYCLFVNSHIAYTKSGAILKASLQKMQEHFALNNEYQQIDFLVAFINDFKPNITKTTNPDTLKLTITSLLKAPFNTNLSLLPLLEPQIRGGYDYYEQTHIAALFQSLHTLFSQIPTQEWVTFDTLIEAVGNQNLQSSLRYDYHNTSYLSPISKQKIAIDDENFFALITKPLYTQLFTLCASLGLVTLTQNTKQKALRLTQLGEYVFHLTPSYKSTLTTTKESTLTLSQDRLLIQLSGSNPINTIIAQSVAEQRTQNIYQFSYDILYRDCKKSDDVLQKLDRLFANAQEEIPPLWKTLFSDIHKKANPLQAKPSYLTFSLDPDPKLLEILATDNEIRTLLFKAEQCMIVVNKENLPILKQKLRKYGYFFESN